MQYRQSGTVLRPDFLLEVPDQPAHDLPIHNNRSSSISCWCKNNQSRRSKVLQTWNGREAGPHWRPGPSCTREERCWTWRSEVRAPPARECGPYWATWPTAGWWSWGWPGAARAPSRSWPPSPESFGSFVGPSVEPILEPWLKPLLEPLMEPLLNKFLGLY